MSETNTSQDHTEFHRLWWHSRRGMLLEEVYRDLSAEDQARYRKLLSCEDTDMFEWFMQRSKPEDPDLRHIVDMILNRVQPD